MKFIRKLDVLSTDANVDITTDRWLLFAPQGADMSGYFKVADAVAEVTPVTKDDLLVAQVGALRSQRETLIAETKATLDKIDARLHELQALPNGVPHEVSA